MIQLNIRGKRGFSSLIHCNSDQSVGKLRTSVKDIISATDSDEVRLVHNGDVLHDPELALCDTAIQNKDTIVALLIRAWTPAPPRDVAPVVATCAMIDAATKHFAGPTTPVIDAMRSPSKMAEVALAQEFQPIPPSLEAVFMAASLGDEMEGGMSSAPHSECVAQLVELGFSEAAATKALIISGHDIEQAMEWLLDHPEEATLPGAVSEKPLAKAHVAAVLALGSLEGQVEAGGILDEASPLVQAIRDSPEIQKSFANPRVLEAFYAMTTDPNAAHQYLADPEIGPVLMKLHDVLVQMSLT